MRYAYFRETLHYSVNQLQGKLGASSNEIAEIIDKLKMQDVLKPCDNNMYQFRYVGIAVIDDIVIYSYPKYITDESNLDDKLSLIFRLFFEYSRRENIDTSDVDTLSFEGIIDSCSELSLLVFLVTDYIENGLYSNDKTVYEINGSGDIDWVRTIEREPAYLIDNSPIYLDLNTYSTVEDSLNYFKLLHMAVLNECCKRLRKVKLLGYLKLPNIKFDVDYMKFSDKVEVIYNIQRELNSQFITRKQTLLKALLAFAMGNYTGEKQFSCSLYGTRHFEIVWEKVLSFILNNKYEQYKEMIGKPIWVSENGHRHSANKTLIPDIITEYRNDSETYFVIADAKYYNITLSDSVLSGNPGVEDVSKQYLYELQFKSYAMDKGYKMANVLLFPSDDKRVSSIGHVELQILKDLNLSDIKLYKLPCKRVFELYIESRKLRNSKR